MSSRSRLKQTGYDFLTAVQFLTRIPIPSRAYEAQSLPRSIQHFPAVGLLIGSCAALLHTLIAVHLPRIVSALIVITFTVVITGCFHEDGLADAADGLGGGRDREQALLIMRDSRIGTYGATALVLSLLFRCILLSTLPLLHVWQYLMAAHMLCRWTTLPLSFLLPSARASHGEVPDGQGARVALQTSWGALIYGTAFTWIIALLLLHRKAIVPISIALSLTVMSGLYYKHRLGGITGDCFGATNQLTEIAVYLCGVWVT